MIRAVLALALAALASASTRALASGSPNCTTMVMVDSVGDGWDGDSFVVTDAEGSVVSSGTVESGNTASTEVCLVDGCYTLAVGGGAYPSEHSWSLGDLSGGSPYSGAFGVVGGAASGEACTSVESVFCLDMELFDSYGDGWAGDVYSIVDSSGVTVFSGTLPSGSATFAERVCLLAGECYSLEVGGGEWQSEVSWALGALAGGAPFGPQDISVVEGEVAGSCGDSVESCFAMEMMDSYGDGWSSDFYSVLQLDTGEVVASGTLASEAFATHEVCLAREKCYSLEVGGGEWQSEVSWSLGGNALYGGAPFGPRLFSVSFEGELVANCDTPAPSVSPAPSFSRAPTLAPTLSSAPTAFARDVATFAELVEAFAGSEREVAMAVSSFIVLETSVTVVLGTNRTVFGVSREAHLSAARSNEWDSETRLFTVSNGGRLTLADIGVSNGYAYGDGGGVLVYEGGALTLERVTASGFFALQGGVVYVHAGGAAVFLDCTCFDNYASNYGAVAYAYGGAVDAVGGAFSNNSAFEGAVFFNAGGTLSVHDANFTANVAFEYLAGIVVMTGSGGAVFVSDGTELLVDSCRFERNLAHWQGGAVYSVRSFLTVVDSVFVYNAAADRGGALYDEDGLTGLVQSSSFAHNVAASGGAVGAELYHTSLTANLTLALRNSTFTKNYASEGGAILVDYPDGDTDEESPEGRFFIENATVESNSAEFGGGGVYVRNGWCTIASSVFLNNDAYAAGAVLAENSGLRVKFTKFHSNSATLGGAVYATENYNGVSLENCSASLNVAGQGGFAFCADTPCAFVDDTHLTTVVRNAAAQGAGVYVSAYASATLDGLTFVENKADDGGALFAALQSKVTVKRVASVANTASNNGAFVHAAARAELTLRDSSSQRDTAIFYGAGVYAGDSASVLVRDSFFQNSHAAAGAVYAQGSELVLFNCTFERCTASFGAALAAVSFQSVTVANCTFSKNEAQLAAGALSFVGASALESAVSVRSSVFKGNSALDGGALDVSAASLTIDTCLFEANFAGADGGVATLHAGAVLVANWCSFVNNSAGVSAGVARLDVGGAFPFGKAAHLASVNCTFERNRAIAGDGGVLVLKENASLFERDNSFYENTASKGGGAIAFFDWLDTEMPSVVHSSVGIGNAALYGQVAASAATSIECSHVGRRSENSGYVTQGQIEVRALDAYGQTVKTLQDLVSLQTVNTSSATLGQRSAKFEEGVATFEGGSLTLVQAPDTNIHLRFKLAYSAKVPPSVFAVPLRACRAGEELQHAKCVPCEAGFYSFVAGAECRECPEHAKCQGTTLVSAKKQYWRAAYDADEVRKCRFPEFCRGKVELWGNWSREDGEVRHLDTDAQCTKKHTGPLCALCEESYMLDSTSGACVLCSKRAKHAANVLLISLLSAALVAVIFLGVIHYFFNWLTHVFIRVFRYVVEAQSLLSARFKVLICFYQILGSFTFAFPGVLFPSVFLSFAAKAAGLGLNVGTLLSAGCVESYDFLDQLVLATLAPIGLAVGMLALFQTQHARLLNAWSSAALEDQDVLDEDAKLSLRNAFATVFLFGTYLVYTSCSSAVVRALQCDTGFDDSKNSEFYQDEYLFVDYTISCLTVRYRLHETYALVMVFVYPLGIPLLYLVAMSRHLNEINPRDRLKLATRIIVENDGIEERTKEEATRVTRRQRDLDEKRRHRAVPTSKSGKFKQASIQAVETQRNERNVRKLLDKRQLVRQAREFCEVAQHGMVGLLAKNHPDLHGTSATAEADTAVVQVLGDQLVVANRSKSMKCGYITFLFDEFVPSCWYFEALECLRRLLLTCVLPVPGIHPDSIAHVEMGALVALFFALCYAVLRPFNSKVMGAFASAMQIILFLNLFLTILIYADANLESDVSSGLKGSAGGILMVVMNVVMAPIATLSSILLDDLDAFVELEIDGSDLITGARGILQNAQRKSAIFGSSLHQRDSFKDLCDDATLSIPDAKIDHDLDSPPLLRRTFSAPLGETTRPETDARHLLARDSRQDNTSLKSHATAPATTYLTHALQNVFNTNNNPVHHHRDQKELEVVVVTADVEDASVTGTPLDRWRRSTWMSTSESKLDTSPNSPRPRRTTFDRITFDRGSRGSFDKDQRGSFESLGPADCWSSNQLELTAPRNFQVKCDESFGCFHPTQQHAPNEPAATDRQLALVRGDEFLVNLGDSFSCFSPTDAEAHAHANAPVRYDDPKSSGADFI